MNTASSCLRFLESQREKYIELMKTGDVIERRSRCSAKEVDQQFAKAKLLISQGQTRKEAAGNAGMNYQTLIKRLKKDA